MATDSSPLRAGDWRGLRGHGGTYRKWDIAWTDVLTQLSTGQSTLAQALDPGKILTPLLLSALIWLATFCLTWVNPEDSTLCGINQSKNMVNLPGVCGSKGEAAREKCLFFCFLFSCDLDLSLSSSLFSCCDKIP